MSRYKSLLFSFLRDVKERIREVVKPTRYHYLYTTIKATKPCRILEIGTWNGDRAVKMIRIAQRTCRGEVEYYGLDLFDEMNESLFEHEISKRPPTKTAVETKLRETGARIFLIQGNTTQLPDSVWLSLPQMDFVFIDGGHSLETIANDWKRVQPLMHENTIVIFDDYWNRIDAGAKPIVDAIDRGIYDVRVLPITDVFQKEDGILRIQFAAVQKKT